MVMVVEMDVVMLVVDWVVVVVVISGGEVVEIG